MQQSIPDALKNLTFVIVLEYGNEDIEGLNESITQLEEHSGIFMRVVNPVPDLDFTNAFENALLCLSSKTYEAW